MAVSNRSMRELLATDAMPVSLRECVHEYGFAIVSVLVKHGIKRPNHIHEVVREIWRGARQPMQKTARGQNATTVMNRLDWIIIQQGADLRAHTLLRVLRDHHMTIVPLEPTPAMVDASMATVSNFDQLVTKREKHTRRLRAATRAAISHLWPHLVEGRQ